MSLVLQVSDPHFGTERPEVVVALERLCARLRPDLLLMSGDITQRARRSQFERARAFVDRLAVPATLIIPGNHDIPLFNLPQRLLAPYRNFRRAFGAELAPQFENADLLALGVNTTRWWRHADGEVSAAQVQAVAQRLQRSRQQRPAQWRLVVVHQPVAVTRPQDRHNLLHGHEQALRAWSAAGADMVLGGHIHLPYVLALHRQMAGLPNPIWAVQAGTAVSHRVRAEAGNSVNVVRADAGAGPLAARRCSVERWDHDPGRDDFEPVALHPLDADHGP